MYLTSVLIFCSGCPSCALAHQVMPCAHSVHVFTMSQLYSPGSTSSAGHSRGPQTQV
ncbi:hypothetical protein B0H10DRAFT_2034176 [Mycena sp. CBHHK59/15]|nr:hypothetical protein B0H10DRAFT_2054539 [Mycena sp. CBHHK59/15]KAJ6617276.1 hypothetical protein B0H10DRAFT_2034176 [Mycena sp. CBHHK59/15]